MDTQTVADGGREVAEVATEKRMVIDMVIDMGVIVMVVEVSDTTNKNGGVEDTTNFCCR
jgi:bacillopeptidase F (M6 metalloprotease family)